MPRKEREPKDPHDLSFRGRPPVQMRMQRDLILRELYDIGLSPQAVMEKTKIGQKAVYGFFNKMDKLLLDERDEDFIRKQKLSIERALRTIDRVTARLAEQQQKIDNKMEEYEIYAKGQVEASKRGFTGVHYFLENKRTELDMQILELTKVRVEIANRPTADQLIEQHIAEKLQKAGITLESKTDNAE